MSKLGEDLIEAMSEAVAHAHGEDRKLVVHRVQLAIPDVKAIRTTLKLTQEAFAQRYGFSVKNIRNWEQGIRLPEGPARAYLTVIARNHKAVELALNASDG